MVSIPALIVVYLATEWLCFGYYERPANILLNCFVATTALLMVGLASVGALLVFGLRASRAT